MTSYQKVNAVLRKAGYETQKQIWVTEGNIKHTELTKGYRVIKTRIKGEEIVAVSCHFCLDKVSEIMATLKANGIESSEVYPGGGMIKVK